MELINAYIDSFDKVTILIDKSIYKQDKKFYYYPNNRKKLLCILNEYDDGKYYKYIIKNPGVDLHLEYRISDDDLNETIIKSGSIVRDPKFDLEYFYDGPLGFEYHKEYTIFRIWSPCAKEIIVDIFNNNGFEKKIPLEYVSKGLWSIKVDMNLDGYGYKYLVRVFDKFLYTLDPYGISSAVNSSFNYVIDMSKTYKMQSKKPEFSGVYTDAIVYEASIRDFTINATKNKGLYNTMVDDTMEIPAVKYMADLGISHLQLLPIFDFYGVDDNKKNIKYNWGYNPVQYMVPSGWFSAFPNDPYERINELKNMIDKYHEAGIRIISDVVFNHVYDTKTFPFDILVPGYAYRVELNGSYNNATGCGNTLATERLMVRRFFKDTIKFWMEEYKISGFRFDLMGLIDVETLNQIKDLALKIDSSVMLYGEGWNMPTTIPQNMLGNMYNFRRIPLFAFFNDRYRDSIRGSQYNGIGGFLFNTNSNIFDVINLLVGSCHNYFKFESPCQTINYLECHDNYTLYDYAKYVLKMEDDEEIFERIKLGIQMILISIGVPFIHSGMETYHSKNGIENSYKSNDDINSMKYEVYYRHCDDVLGLKDLIKIRKEYDVFRIYSEDDVSEKIHLLEALTTNTTITLLYIGKKSDMVAVIKNDNLDLPIKFKNAIMIFDGIKRTNIDKDSFVIKNRGLYLFEIGREK